MQICIRNENSWTHVAYLFVELIVQLKNITGTYPLFSVHFWYFARLWLYTCIVYLWYTDYDGSPVSRLCSVIQLNLMRITSTFYVKIIYNYGIDYIVCNEPKFWNKTPNIFLSRTLLVHLRYVKKYTYYYFWHEMKGFNGPLFLSSRNSPGKWAE